VLDVPMWGHARPTLHDGGGSSLAVVAWQTALREQGLAPAVINNHLASLSAFTTWVQAQAPGHDRPRRGPCPINARGTRTAIRSGRARAGAVS
jgi:hypothetical protein